MVRRLASLAVLALVLVSGCGKNAPPNSLPDTEALKLADNQWSRGDMPRAEKTLQGILERDSRNFAARYRLGVLQIEDSPRDAIASLEQAAALAPEHPGPRFFIGLTRLQLGDRNGAIADMSAGLALADARRGYSLPDTTETVRRGLAALRRERFAEAMGAFHEALAADSTDATLWYLEALASLEAGLWPQGERAARAALRRRSSFPEAHVVLAGVYSGEGRKAEAHEELQIALAHSPSLASAHYRLGMLLLKSSEYHMAARRIWIALLEDPTNPRYFYALGRVFLRMGLRDAGTFYLARADDIRSFLAERENAGAPVTR